MQPHLVAGEGLPNLPYRGSRKTADGAAALDAWARPFALIGL